MKHDHFQYIPFSAEALARITATRAGEIKLGERIQAGYSPDTRFVLIGVCEDIGPQANFGNPGSRAAFRCALSKLVNMQSNRRYIGTDLCIAGFIEQLVEFSTIDEARRQVSELDALLIDLLAPIYANGQIPILIGGGHNNAYPLIRAYSEEHKKGLEVVNMDPHADCRPLEGRHSGNPFSYARKDGCLSQYTVLGLHAAYNSESMLSYLNEQEFYYSYFEEYIVRPEKLDSDLQTIIIRSDDPIGIELDLDAIQHMPSSAYTPSGIQLETARKYLMRLSSSKRSAAYLHLPEGAPCTPEEEKTVGKAIAYLIHDFVSTYK